MLPNQNSQAGRTRTKDKWIFFRVWNWFSLFVFTYGGTSKVMVVSMRRGRSQVCSKSLTTPTWRMRTISGRSPNNLAWIQNNLSYSFILFSICRTALTWSFCMFGEVPSGRTKFEHTEQYIQHYTDTIHCTYCTRKTLHSSLSPKAIIHTILKLHRGHNTMDSMRST